MAIRSSIQSIDYQTLIKNTSIADRVSLAGTRSGQALMASLSPTELAAAFPDYYRRASPDVSGFISAQTKKNEGKVAPSATAASRTSTSPATTPTGNYRSGAENKPFWKSELERQTGVSIGEDERNSRRYRATESAGERQAAIVREANRLGIPPVDLAAVMSYESAGTFDPDKRGPVDKRASAAAAVRQGAQPYMLGLIQFGAEEQIKFGIKPGMGFDAQMAAVGRFLEVRGYRRWLDQNPNATEQERRIALYSTINAGNPNREYWGARDAGMGGAPGTVIDKVNSIFSPRSGHLAKAQNLMQASYTREEESANYRRQREAEIPALPQGISPQLLEEYNRMSPRQQRNFQTALGKLDQDSAAAVEKMNRIFQQNPAIIDRAAAQGASFNYTSVSFSSDRIRSGVSQLSQETQTALQRLDSLGVPLTVTSTFRSPEQNRRTAGSSRTSLHMSGNALDVRTRDKSPEELQRIVQSLKRAGFNKVLIEKDHIHAEIHSGSNDFNVSLRPGHNNPNISLDQATAAAQAVPFREQIQQANTTDAEERRRRLQIDPPRQESTATPTQQGDVNAPQRRRNEQLQPTVIVGGDSIGQGVGRASRVQTVASQGERFTSGAMFNQLTRVPRGGTFHMYAGTNDAANGIVDPEAYDRQMARLSEYARENGINLKIYGPHKSNKPWDERYGSIVDRNMAEAAQRYGIQYTSNRSIAANAGDGVHFDNEAYANMAIRNNIIPAMADGGAIEGVEDPSKITAIPMKSGRDDTLLMNNGEPVAKVNSDEKMTYDSERNRVTVTPRDRANADDLAAKIEERQQEVKDAPVLGQPQLAPTKPIEEVTPYTRERDFVDPVVPTDAALNDSMRRVMARNSFKEEGGHFSFGASNFST